MRTLTLEVDTRSEKEPMTCTTTAPSVTPRRARSRRCSRDVRPCISRARRPRSFRGPSRPRSRSPAELVHVTARAATTRASSLRPLVRVAGRLAIDHGRRRSRGDACSPAPASKPRPCPSSPTAQARTRAAARPCSPLSFSPVRAYASSGDAMADATLAAYPGTALTRMENARARRVAHRERSEPGLGGGSRQAPVGRGPPGPARRRARRGEHRPLGWRAASTTVDATTMVLPRRLATRTAARWRASRYGNRSRSTASASPPTLTSARAARGACARRERRRPRRAHLQFRTEDRLKLVWVPGPANDVARFVLVDDEPAPNSRAASPARFGSRQA